MDIKNSLCKNISLKISIIYIFKIILVLFFTVLDDFTDKTSLFSRRITHKYIHTEGIAVDADCCDVSLLVSH